MHLLVLGLGGVEDRGPGLDAGVVDHDVEAAHLLHRGVDEHLQVRDLADVRLDPDGLVARGPRPAFRDPRWPASSAT